MIITLAELMDSIPLPTCLSFADKSEEVVADSTIEFTISSIVGEKKIQEFIDINKNRELENFSLFKDGELFIIFRKGEIK